MPLADFISGDWPTTCNSGFTTSGADYGESLTTDQLDMMVFSLRAHDNNSSCFPGTNENAAISHTLQSCCWTNGLANCTSCGAQWRSHDLSLLKLSRLSPSSCSAGAYPCNENGWYNGGASCYDTSCKVQWADVYVR